MSSEPAVPPAGEPPPAQIMRMLSGYWISQALYAAAKLELADRLAGGPQTAAALAGATGMQPRALHRLLRMLASLGVFRQTHDGAFEVTPLAACLQRHRPGSQWAVAMMLGGHHYPSWGELLYSLETGLPAFDKIHGQPIFDYLSQHPDEGAIFDAAMVGVHGRETAAMLDAFDFSRFRTLMDVGGGNGSLLRATLERIPALQGVLFDLPEVIARAEEGFAGSPVAHRCRFLPGSFFEAVPAAGADAILMRHIIHDWDDDKSAAILRHCHAALPADGWLLLIESVIAEDDRPQFAKLLDLNMLVIPGGVERTAAEYRDLFAQTGFTLTEIVPTTAEICVIVGRKHA